MNQMMPNSSSQGTQPKPGWEEIVQASGGTRVFLPSKFEKEAKAIEDDRAKFKLEVEKMAEAEIKHNVRMQNLFLAVREQLAKDGHEEIWTKDIGFDSDALKEGKFVVNLFQDQQR